MWHSLEIKEVLTKLNVSEDGLDKTEAAQRLEKIGPNKLPEEKKLTQLQIFFNQFKSPLVYILLVAAIITIFLDEFIDTGVILAAVLLNTIVGFFQEVKAEKTIERLRMMIEHKARVIRNGKEMEINAEELVPGDIILVEAGDKITADARLVEAHNLQIIEAPLTGESAPSNKDVKILAAGTVLADRENIVYMGTNVVRGRGKAVVIETGVRTELGKIALMVKEAGEEKTPLQKQLSKFSKWLAVVFSVLCLCIFLFGIVQGRPFIEIFLTAVAVAVAAIPEGLLVALTVILAIGMQRILKERALVRKLVAAETLGSVSVICSDKTGTITLGKMMVDHIFTESKSEKSRIRVLEIGLLCNNAVIQNPEEELENLVILGDATEQALLLAALQTGLRKEEIEKQKPRIDEIPFDEEKKYMATLHAVGNSKVIFIKGAPEVVLEMSGWLEVNGEKEKFSGDRIKNFEKEIDDLTQKGLRLLAVAYKEDGNLEELKDLVLVGLVALKDPLRQEARDTMEACKKAGIRPILITGDHRLTAKTIAQEIGLPAGEENILEGKDLDKMNDEKFNSILRQVNVYARVLPQHKMRIIEAWQKKGEVVAMTGDGVNDAPALKKADIGVALGSGTEVAKEVSDMVLLDDNFATIVKAVKQGRAIFENIRKVITYLLSDSFTEMILVGGSLLLGLPLPVLAAQILWVNLIEDGLPSIALSFEPEERGLMREKPRKKTENILNAEMKIIIFVIGIFTDLLLFGLFYYFWEIYQDIEYTRTIVFVGLGINSLFYVWSCRSLRFSLWHMNPFKNKFLNISVIFGFLMFFIALYVPFFQKVLRTVPLGIRDWGIILFLGLINLLLIELVKFIFITRHKKEMRILNNSSVN
ncbi:MAG: HAD-IC family P-type ATPase [Patescibacteria group bacterium]